MIIDGYNYSCLIMFQKKMFSRKVSYIFRSSLLFMSHRYICMLLIIHAESATPPIGSLIMAICLSNSLAVCKSILNDPAVVVDLSLTHFAFIPFKFRIGF